MDKKAVNPWVFYGCCRWCNRTPTVAGIFNKDGYCATCQKRMAGNGT